MPDDPIAARSDRLVGWFTFYVRWSFARNFHAVRISRAGLPTIPPGRPLIIYTNHPSWWDPALFYVLMDRFFRGRRGFGPMDGDALEKYGVMKRLGVFPVSSTRQGAAQFLTLTRRMLADPANVLWVTAEGHFTDQRQRPVRIRPGVAHLARGLDGVTIVPLALEYPFWNESKPEVLLRFGAPMVSGAGQTVTAWTEMLEAELERTMDALAADSIARDPSRFLTLNRGRVGVGGPYDLWRAFKARLAGRTFDPSHEGAGRDGPSLESPSHEGRET